MKLSYESPICPYCNTSMSSDGICCKYTQVTCHICGFNVIAKKKAFPNGKVVFETRRIKECDKLSILMKK